MSSGSSASNLLVVRASRKNRGAPTGLIPRISTWRRSLPLNLSRLLEDRTPNKRARNAEGQVKRAGGGGVGWGWGWGWLVSAWLFIDGKPGRIEDFRKGCLERGVHGA